MTWPWARGGPCAAVPPSATGRTGRIAPDCTIRPRSSGPVGVQETVVGAGEDGRTAGAGDDRPGGLLPACVAWSPEWRTAPARWCNMVREETPISKRDDAPHGAFYLPGIVARVLP